MLRAQVLVVLPGLDDGENLPALWDRSNDGGRGLLYVYVSEVLAEITLETISDFDRHMCLQMKVALGAGWNRTTSASSSHILFQLGSFQTPVSGPMK
jgi:hypothetical protein